MKIVIGHSDFVDAVDAIDEVLHDCEAQLDGKIPQAGILFAGIDFDHQVLLDGILQQYPSLLLIGGTSDAQLSDKFGVVEDSVLLVLFESPTVSFSVGYATEVSQGQQQATQQAIDMAKGGLKGEPKLCFTVFDTLTTSGLTVLKGLNQALGPSTPILGGAAADQFKMERSFQFAQGQVFKDGVTVLLIAGDILFSYGVSSGRSITGEPQKVGRVEGNRIYEIGDMTAVEFYTKYLGSMDKVIGEFPLAVFEAGEPTSFLRSPGKYNDDGSIEFFADIPPDSKVQLTLADRDAIIGAVETAFQMAYDAYPGGKPQAMQITSCAGRKAVLGTRVAEEYEHLQQISNGIPIFGFYGFGEICPLGPNSLAKFHNETIVVWLMGEL